MTLTQAIEINTRLVSKYSDYFTISSMTDIVVKMPLVRIMTSTFKVVVIYSFEEVYLEEVVQIAKNSDFFSTALQSFHLADYTEAEYEETVDKHLQVQISIIDKLLKVAERSTIDNLIEEVNNI